jgi:hypothetical protein
MPAAQLQHVVPVVHYRHVLEIGIMKTLIGLSLAVSALLAPALSFAQATNAPLTRAQVYADLVRVEQAGYNPSASDDSTYPADIQSAEAKVAAQSLAQADNQANTPADTQANTATVNTPAVEATSVGAATEGTSASGMRDSMRESMKGRMGNASCVGPVSFCSTYFGG